MALFRIFSELTTFFDNQGELLAGGELRFYEAGTTTPQDVYGSSSGSPNNGATVALDASGRPDVDVWGGDGQSYFVELYDADGVKQGEMDDVSEPGGGAATIPALQAGEFLTNNGSTMSWEPVREVPDPSGQANKVLSTDGTALIWIPKPSDGAPGDDASNVGSDATSLFIGDFHIQTGNGTAAATNSEVASVSVTFPEAFTSVPVHIGVTVKDITSVSGHALVAHSVTNVTVTGFTLNFNIADRHYTDGSKIVNNIPFTYAAFGVKTA